MAQTILIVEDDPAQLRLFEAVIGSLGYEALPVSDGEAALTRLDELGSSAEPDLVLLDRVLPGIDGIETLEKIRAAHPELPVIILTMEGGVNTIVKAMRAGAVDFLMKPVSPERLEVSIENALKLRTLTGELSRMERKISGEFNFSDLIYQSDQMRAVADLAQRGARSNIPILIEGESGVGKELVARAIQGSGDRAGGAFVAVNCGAIPENLVESILFGHEKGAFTGADSKHSGKFLEASGGTLFLDEVGELQPDIQVKLLRALQEGEIDPVGSNKPVSVDVRLISATNKNLLQMVRDGRFREDLYYRLNDFPVMVPPLRTRKSDVTPLTEYFVAKFAASEKKSVRGLSDETLALLQDFDWPGNVRQLENAVFRATVLCDGEILGIGDFPQIAQQMGRDIPDELGAASTPPETTLSAPENGAIKVSDQGGQLRPLREIELEMIKIALDRNQGHMSKVARDLGIGRSTLYRKVRELGLEPADASSV
jgi:DNA-binding NtrC family response regulator